MTTAEEAAKKLGLTAHPSWDGNESYWVGRLYHRITDLEAGLREIARGVHIAKVCAALADEALTTTN